MDFRPLIKSFQQLGEEYAGDPALGDKVVEDLSKALSLGNYPATAGSTTTDAGPLRLQNLDSTMTSVLFSEQHIKLWNFVTKVPSAQPYYEWNRRRGYGSSRGSAGFAEGGAPFGSASSFERNGIYTKYMGVRRGITHQLTLTGQLGGTQLDPVAEENRNGTMELLEKIERQLWFGDSAVLNEAGQAVNYDGFLKQAKGNLGDATKVKDKAGSPMNFADFEESAQDLYTTGFVSNFDDLHCFMSPTILADLSKLKFQGAAALAGGQIGGEAVDRRLLGSMQDSYITGMPLGGHQTNFGRINFDPWIFAQRVKGDKPTDLANQGGTADPNAPTAPAAASVAINAPTVTGSKWKASDAATVYYRVAAFNDKGESNATITASTAVATNGAATITFPAAPATTTGWRVYRGILSTGADALWIKDVPVASATFQDLNAKIPGTGTVAILNKNPETMVLAQMTPLIRFPLAIVSTTVEWLLLLYHVPVLKAGERIYIWENVGRLA